MDLKWQELTIEGLVFRVALPRDPDAMLQRAVDGEAAGEREADPYWGLLWDASPRTAEAILRHPWTASLRMIELGCGAGLAGLAAVRVGHAVTFTDLVPEALALVRSNAAENNLPAPDCRQLDWRSPFRGDWQLALASDVLYDSGNHPFLLSTLEAVLAPDGCAWIGDAGRHNAARFVTLARESGWIVEVRGADGSVRADVTHLEFQLLILSRRTLGCES